MDQIEIRAKEKKKKQTWSFTLDQSSKLPGVNCELPLAYLFLSLIHTSFTTTQRQAGAVTSHWQAQGEVALKF